MRVLLNERTGADVPAHEAALWVDCEDVCASLAAHGGTPLHPE